jgi:hypothetical protein
LEETIQKNSQKLEELANVIAILKEQQKEEETTSLDQNQIEKELSPCFRLLSFETWTEMFGFVPRPQLAELVPEIGDWRFAEKAQDYLHEFGRITLDDMYIRSSISWINRKKGIPIVKLCDEGEHDADEPGWEYPLPDVPIPKNIINFRSINIRFAFYYNSNGSLSFFSYFNQSVLGFLQEFHRKSLLTNVELNLVKTNFDSNALTQLVPLLTNINKLNLLFHIDIEALIQKEYSKAMLASARILIIQYVFSHKIVYLIWVRSQDLLM